MLPLGLSADALALSVPSCSHFAGLGALVLPSALFHSPFSQLLGTLLTRASFFSSFLFPEDGSLYPFRL